MDIGGGWRVLHSEEGRKGKPRRGGFYDVEENPKKGGSKYETDVGIVVVKMRI